MDKVTQANHERQVEIQEDFGYHKALKPRQIQMIAIGGAIGTGLFLGAGGRLAIAGPALVFAYAICGFFAFLVLRALGELIMHRPTSGSFVSYAREFYGEKMAFAVGWMYWMNWAMTSVADVTAVALYMNFFKQYVPWMQGIDQWVFALGALIIVLGMNMLSVKVFGELEFWFSLIKVLALFTFLIVGVYFVIFGTPIEGHVTGFSLIADNGGFFPNGILPAFIIIQGVLFAYASIELIGTTAGETEDPRKVMPKAIRTVVFRLLVFYVGSVLLLTLLLPYTAYKAGESPFVTFFGSIGVEGADIVMNLVVLTAVLSSLNAGLYSTGRILHSMAVSGSAPAALAKMNKAGVPYGGIAVTAVVTVLGVILNAIVPSEAFEIALNLAALGIICAWGVIVLCQLKLWHLSRQGKMQRPDFSMIGAPYTGILTLVFLFGVLVLMAFDYPAGTYTVGSLIVIAPTLVGGWYLMRGRIQELSKAQQLRDAGARGPAVTVVIPTDHDKGLVAVIATGGTIASQRDETGAAKPSLSGENLLSGLGGDSAFVKPVELMAKDSSSLTISDMQAISDAVGVELADPAVCGVVVLHGTDAMEETSLLVHLQHRLGKPVIFTGAQFTADNPLSDGPANLQAAIAAAATPSNSDKGVLLSFGGKLLPVWGLYKRSADDPDAFDLAGPSDCPQSPEFSAPVDAIRIDIVAIYPGCEATHIDASLDAGAKGIVLCALGSGNANADVVDALRRCRERHVPVVVSSRVPEGHLVAGYGGGGGGHDMGAVGAIHSRTLRPGQSRILLASLIAASAGHRDMARAFNDFRD